MWRKQVSSAVVVCVIGISVANAGLILTIDGSNPTGIPFMMVGTGPYQVALDGNTVIEPNDVRFESVGGTLTVISDVNHQYSFQYIDGSTAGFVWLITNVDMTIDDINVPAETTIYELFIFCNPDVNLTGACGSDLSFFFPPEEEGGESGEGNSGEQSLEQSFMSTEETTSTEELRDLPLSSSGYDQSWDLNPDGVINFNDFAIFANGWETSYNFNDLDSLCSAFGGIDLCYNPIPSNQWQTIVFTGIGGCPLNCNFDISDPCLDDCNNYVYVVCDVTPEIGYWCALNYYFNYTRVGICVYLCGINEFQIMKNINGFNVLKTRHRTQDTLDYGCDEGTENRYDWQIVVTDTLTGSQSGFCRESYSNPFTNGYWESSQGQASTCEKRWW